MKYKIKLDELPLMIAHMTFEVVSQNEDGHWTFDNLEEAKEEALRFLDEQYDDYVNGDDTTNDIIKPKSLIRNTRLSDLVDPFWEKYDENMTRLDYFLRHIPIDIRLEEMDDIIAGKSRYQLIIKKIVPGEDTVNNTPDGVKPIYCTSCGEGYPPEDVGLVFGVDTCIYCADNIGEKLQNRGLH